MQTDTLWQIILLLLTLLFLALNVNMISLALHVGRRISYFTSQSEF